MPNPEGSAEVMPGDLFAFFPDKRVPKPCQRATQPHLQLWTQTAKLTSLGNL